MAPASFLHMDVKRIRAGQRAARCRPYREMYPCPTTPNPRTLSLRAPTRNDKCWIPDQVREDRMVEVARVGANISPGGLRIRSVSQREMYPRRTASERGRSPLQGNVSMPDTQSPPLLLSSRGVTRDLVRHDMAWIKDIHSQPISRIKSGMTWVESGMTCMLDVSMPDSGTPRAASPTGRPHHAKPA